MEYAPYLIFAIALCGSHLVQGITGFGSVVLVLPLLSFFFPLKILIPTLILVNLVQTIWFTVRDRSHIRAYHARSLVLLSLAGLPLGYAVYRYLPADQLKVALGVVVTFVAIWNLAGFSLGRPLPDLFYHLLNLVGGLLQGAMACGGPFLVIYAARMLEDKTEFRATLSLVWTVLNVILVGVYTATGVWKAEMLPLAGLALPSLVFGTALGMYLHDRMPIKPFRVLVFSVLFVSGLVLLAPAASRIFS